MIFLKLVEKMNVGGTLAVVAALGLASCATEMVDDTTGSRLTQTPAGTPPTLPIEAGDIAIAGQYFAKSIRDLAVVAQATTPPLVQFTGVTSIINGYVDTDPYTGLLRDRLLLGTRDKLRFVEKQLPPLITSNKKVKGRKDVPGTVKVRSVGGGVDDLASPSRNPEADYQVLAELRGHLEDSQYLVQIQLVDYHNGEVLFDGLYRIRKETPPPMPEGAPEQAFPPAGQPVDSSATGVPNVR